MNFSDPNMDHLAKYPAPLTANQERKIFENQTAILKWLLSRGHNVEDQHLQPDPPAGGLDRFLDKWTTTVTCSRDLK